MSNDYKITKLNIFKSQLENVAYKFANGGKLTVGSHSSCDCMTNLGLFPEEIYQELIETTINHRINKIKNLSYRNIIYFILTVWYSMWGDAYLIWEFDIDPHLLLPLNTAPDYDIESTINSIIYSISYWDIYTNRYYSLFKSKTKINNSNPNNYADEYLSLITLQEIIYKHIEHPFTIRVTEDCYYIDFVDTSIFTVKMPPSPTVYMAQQIFDYAVSKNDICPLSYIYLSEEPFVFVNNCGHIFGSFADKLDICPICRAPWIATQLINNLKKQN